MFVFDLVTPRSLSFPIVLLVSWILVCGLAAARSERSSSFREQFPAERDWFHDERAAGDFQTYRDALMKFTMGTLTMQHFH